MHEYRLEDGHSQVQQGDGWVVCRVFRKNHARGCLQAHELREEDYTTRTHTTGPPRATFRNQPFITNILITPDHYSSPLITPTTPSIPPCISLSCLAWTH